MKPIDDLAGAAMLLTRLPTGWLSRTPSLPAESAWAFPVVGGLVGGAGGVVFRLGIAVHLPPLLAAGWSMIALLLLTGGLHEDGLADTADGFGGGDTVERKLQIMRDSRIGSYGALGVVMSLLIRTVALAALPPAGAIPALIAVGAAARTGILGAMLWMPPARRDGLGEAAARAGSALPMLGLLVGAAICVTALPVRQCVAVIVAVVAATASVCALSRRQIGGHTGDVLGAVEQCGECAALTSMLVAWSAP